MIARLKGHDRVQVPVADLAELRSESDVEQKLVYPFLVHPSFMDFPHEWVRTKEYMEPTEIDKTGGEARRLYSGFLRPGSNKEMFAQARAIRDHRLGHDRERSKIAKTLSFGIDASMRW